MTTPRATARILAATGLALAIAFTSSGCTRLQGRQGFIADPVLSNAIAVGVDNRESVEKTLGRPTFVGQLGDSDWYYFSRDTRRLAFANPSPVAQQVLRVRFDPAGNVAAVERTGMERVVALNPNGDATPTLGRQRTFLEDVFGNIGTVNSTGAGGGRGPGG